MVPSSLHQGATSFDNANQAGEAAIMLSGTLRKSNPGTRIQSLLDNFR
jgi:hypothetical protein